MTDYKLYLFDLDGTLAPFDSSTLYPDAAQWLATHESREWAICTNQGGIGLRYWMEEGGFGEPEKYPTLELFWNRIDALFPERGAAVYMCPRYQSKKTGQWSPVPSYFKNLDFWSEDFRKPAPGMLMKAMKTRDIQPQDTLMIGDSEEDQQAAVAAGCDFIWAHEFFGREKTE